MNRLREAYEQIIDIYGSEGLSPEPLEWISFGLKWTGVFSEGAQGGIAFNFTGEHGVYGPVDPAPLYQLRPFAGKDLSRLAEFLEEKEGILYSSLYLAVLNALSNPLNSREMLNKRGFFPACADDFGFAGKDDFVTVIGAAGHIVDHLLHRCKEVHVSDMRPKSVLETVFVGEDVLRGPPGVVFHGPEDNESLLAASDIVMMTGSTLVNGTFFELIPMIKKARVIGLFGPSAMLLPDFLFRQGVNFIMSSHISDPSAMKNRLFGGFCGKKFEECMESYAIRNI